jgi:ribosomal protein L7/L12
MTDAIKAVREATDWGLKESKDYVEGLLLGGAPSRIERF